MASEKIDASRSGILLGDAYELIKQMPDKSVDLVVTDPPYEFDDPKSDFSDRPRSAEESMALAREEAGGRGSRVNDDMRSLSKQLGHIASGFDPAILGELVRVMKAPNIYVWCSRLQIRRIWDYFDDLGCSLDMLTWHKDNPIPTNRSAYLHDTEYCIFARGQGAHMGGPFEDRRKWWLTHTNKDGKESYGHPTVKPLQIISALVSNSSAPGDLVLDPFSGSGTTCAAAKELGRRYLGFEIDEGYWRASVDRLNGIDRFGQTSLLDTDFDLLGEKGK
jgi:DNA modification methylase